MSGDFSTRFKTGDLVKILSKHRESILNDNVVGVVQRYDAVNNCYVVLIDRKFPYLADESELELVRSMFESLDTLKMLVRSFVRSIF